MPQRFIIYALLFVCSNIFGQNLDGFLASVKASGMGSTGVAYPQDSLAGAYNPAGMVNVCDRVDVGFYWTKHEGEIEIKDNSRDGVNGTFEAYRRKNFYAGDFGINKCFCLCNVPFAVGFIAYQNQFFNPNYKEPLPLFGLTPSQFEFINYVFAPTVAFKVWGHAFGVAININQSHLKINGVEKFLLESSSPTNLSNKRGQTVYGAGFTFGWQWDVLECLRVGVTFRPKTKMQKFDKYEGFIAEKGLIDIPPLLAGGIAWKIIPELTVTFDVEEKYWKLVRSFSNKLEPAFDQAAKFVTSSRLGRKNASGFGFKNQTLFHLGVDYTFNPAWTIRAGYQYAKCPIKDDETFFNQLTLETVQNQLSVGLSFSYNTCNELSLFYAYGFEGHVKGKKNSIPSILGGGQSDLRSKLMSMGLSWGMWF